MRKTLLLLGSFLCLSLASNAQAIYTEPFTGTTIPTGWTTGPSFTLTTSGILNVVMTDSVGPQQPSGPAANWDAFQYVFTSPVDMTVGCKCISFFVDNTGNEILNLAIQVQDVNHDPLNSINKYTDAPVSQWKQDL